MQVLTQGNAARRSFLVITALTLLLGLTTPLRADDKPDEVLKANELSRIGAVYVLPIEATLPESLRALRIAQKPIDDHASVRAEIEKTKAANDKLIAALGIMEATHEDPRPVHEIAADVGLSPRQLERLFAKYLQASPSQHYLKLRLERARAMLLQTTNAAQQSSMRKRHQRPPRR